MTVENLISDVDLDYLLIEEMRIQQLDDEAIPISIDDLEDTGICLFFNKRADNEKKRYYMSYKISPISAYM